MLELIQAYESYLQTVKKASDNTVSSYMRDVRQFSDWLQATKGGDMLKISEEDINRYLLSLNNAGKSGSTVSRSLASLKNFYSYVVSTGALEKSPVSNEIHIARGEKKVPQILTSEEIDLLLEQPDCSDAKGIRDKAMLEMLYATGMRVSELIELNCTDVNTELNVVQCGDEKQSRVIPIYPEAIKSLLLYLEEGRPTLISNVDEHALFVNLGGTRMSRQGFWKILKHYQAKAGIEKEITPHTLRHSFAVHLLTNGADIAALQELMGHKDISSTQVYAHMINQKIKSVYLKCHPKA